MTIINKKDIKALAEVHDAFCVSVFIPTHRAGMEVLEQQDSVLLKTHLKDIKHKLAEQGMKDADITQMLQPAQDLIGDRIFWSNQSDGLAVFLAPGFFTYYTVPVMFESFHYLSNAFYLKPLMPMLTGDGLYFLLALQIDNVQLYQATRHSITPIKIEDLVPQEMEESTGYDVKQKNLQMHGQGGGNAMYHGHGEGKDDQDVEIKKYLRDINKGLMEILHDEYMPMLLAGSAEMVARYREVNTYPHVLEKHLPLGEAVDDPVLLHEMAWKLMRPYFDADRKKKLNKYGENRPQGRASADTREILQAALSGRVDCLFLENLQDIWGVYDPQKNKLEISGNKEAPNVSLMNLAAVSVLQHGGDVYLLDKNEMPEPVSVMNALFRY